MATSATTYYSMMSTAGSSYTPVLTGSDPDKQYQMLLSGTVGASGLFESTRVQDLPAFQLSFDVSSSSALADGFSVYFGATSPYYCEGKATGQTTLIAAGMLFSFEVYSPNTPGVYLQNAAGTNLASNTTAAATAWINGAAGWYTVVIGYTKGTTNTWTVSIGGTTLFTYSDASNATWLASAGSTWGFGARAGGQTMNLFLRHVAMTSSSLNLNLSGISTLAVSESNSAASCWQAVSTNVTSMSNVGIKTATPGYKLDVVGDVNASGALRVNGISLTSDGYWTSSGNNVVTSSNVGIGTTSPGSLFHLQGSGYCTGTINFSQTGAGVSWGANYSQIYDNADLHIATDDNLHIYTAGSERIKINNAAQIGINNSSPGWELDVGGDIRSTGWMRIDGNAGWYNNTWGAGWYMTDTTYMRCFQDKVVYSGGGFNCQGFSGGAGTIGGLLTVNGYVSLTKSYGYYNSAGVLSTATNFTGNFSVIAVNRTSCSEMNAISDERAKDEIHDFDGAICRDIVNNLHQKHYRFKPENLYKIGFIAQEVETAFPNAVTQIDRDDMTDFRVLNYSQMTSVLWGAVRKVDEDLTTDIGERISLRRGTTAVGSSLTNMQSRLIAAGL